ncbi:hypothetical protein A2U01_0060088, partial [Trifolium medium]|nr:hypothetical protein [Trifolium medium]
MQSSRAEIQHLAREISSIKEEQSKAIELRNMKVDVVEKQKKDRNSKANEAGDNPTKEAPENALEEEPDEIVEHTAEPTIKGNPKSAPIQPVWYTTEKPRAMVAPYPPKYEKKEAIKE